MPPLHPSRLRANRPALDSLNGGGLSPGDAIMSYFGGRVLWALLPGRGVTMSGTLAPFGTAPPAVTVSGSGNYIGLKVAIDSVTGGTARGQATFKYSADDGTTWIETGVTTAATYALKGDATGYAVAFPVGTYGTTQYWEGALGQWSDQGPAGNHMAIDTATFQPSIRLNAWPGGVAGPCFELLSTRTPIMRIATSPNVGNITIASTLKSSATALVQLFGMNNTGNVAQNDLFDRAAAGYVARYARQSPVVNSEKTNAAAPWFTTATAHSLVWEQPGTHAGHNVRVDGANLALTNGANTADPGTTPEAMPLISIGCSGGGGNRMPGFVQSFFGISGALTSDERTFLEAQLKLLGGTP